MIFQLDLNTGAVQGVKRWERRLSEMAEAFSSQESVLEILGKENPLVYEVYEVKGISEEVGELIWSVTVLYPGRVGDEYFMTKGHYHADPRCAEVYLVLSGQGALVLKDRDGTRVLPVQPGSIVHIPPGCAHRMVNTGDTPLIFFAVFPAQAGHDYEKVRHEGFGVRVLQGKEGPEVQKVW